MEDDSVLGIYVCVHVKTRVQYIECKKENKLKLLITKVGTTRDTIQGIAHIMCVVFLFFVFECLQCLHNS